MKITLVRKISQVFFLVIFLWFAIICSFGTQWWQLRGWPVNLFLQLDPLNAIATMLSTHTVYKGLLWALLTIILTILLGRFFCGWVCPFGTLHQFFGFLGNRKRKTKDRILSNQYNKLQSLKYFFLIAFLIAALVPLGTSTSLLTGILDPIALMTRSVNIIVLPIADTFTHFFSVAPRQYEGAWIIGAIFLTLLFLNLKIPRFYCRFICPTGALLGLLSRFSLWRIGKTEPTCVNCKSCEKACEGACEPSTKIRISECVLCMNCIGSCKHKLIKYQTIKSKAGEITSPDVGRRGLILTAVSGLMAVPLLRMSGLVGANWNNKTIRPPGALPEKEFLQRCIKCGQCMRVCPTNIIMPSGLENGIESLWTPKLNYRIGTSGCQLNCTACGFVCPTSAIRPISLAEKIGVKDFANKGPVRMGTAFIDQTRCLPWSMNTPCIVCQENCPMTPKAIYIADKYNTVRDGAREVLDIFQNSIEVSGSQIKADKYATGDYYISKPTLGGESRYRIIANKANRIELEPKNNKININKSDRISIQVLLHQPYVDIEKCIGCGICEHECPVSGQRAIRVSAENESRSVRSSLLLKKQ